MGDKRDFFAALKSRSEVVKHLLCALKITGFILFGAVITDNKFFCVFITVGKPRGRADFPESIKTLAGILRVNTYFTYIGQYFEHIGSAVFYYSVCGGDSPAKAARKDGVKAVIPDQSAELIRLNEPFF